MLHGIIEEAMMKKTQAKGPDFLEEKGNFLKEINSKITLINNSKDNNIDGEIYNKIYIYKKNGKLYAYNNRGENVFLNGIYGDYQQDFNLIEKDGKILLQVCLTGINYYFLENGEQYFPKNKIDTVIHGAKKIIESIIPYFR